MDAFQPWGDVIFHLDATLNHWVAVLGGWFCALLFLVVFCETGLVIAPFLPGDSLLFAVGALGSTPNSPVNVPVLAVVLATAAVLGDTVNYSLGYRLGRRVLRREGCRFLNRKHLQASRDFYARHGGKTIVLGRFLPIIRTFAPFVAGMARMNYARFVLFNLTGAVAWVGSLVLAGFCFGQVPFVKDHFEMVAVGIVVLSVVPTTVGYLRVKLGTKGHGNSAELHPSPPFPESIAEKEHDAA